MAHGVVIRLQKRQFINVYVNTVVTAELQQANMQSFKNTISEGHMGTLTRCSCADTTQLKTLPVCVPLSVCVCETCVPVVCNR